MKNILKNSGYFLKETVKIIKIDILSTISSVFSIGFIMFILAIIVSGWWVSSSVIEVMQGEAEINAYFKEGIDKSSALKMVESILSIDGVKEARLVDEGEAYDMMEKILGKEADILELFENNPFSPFIEVKIDLEKMDYVVEKINLTTGIEYVRDNIEVLEQLRNIVKVFNLVAYFVVAAVGISTLFIVSHIIRQGIYSNRDQINTLRLLGAPEHFIAIPFLFEGLILTLVGGILASSLTAYTMKYVYVRIAGPLPFLPMPPYETMTKGLIVLLLLLSMILGIAGSILGLSSSKRE